MLNYIAEIANIKKIIIQPYMPGGNIKQASVFKYF